jgi:hypoxanthine-DNA glycosylase
MKPADKTAARIYSFPPVIGAHPKTLILGSMPGVLSLEKGQYYAHPRNHFWPLMQEILGVPAVLPYAQRLAALKENHIALWDVLQSCQRQGSLDGAIKEEVPNDFESLFSCYPDIRKVILNGGKAEASFRKKVLPTLLRPPAIIIRLPSTSPVPSRQYKNLDDKLGPWRVALVDG